MNVNDIATKSDIAEVLNAIEKLQIAIGHNKVEKEILRSADVRKMLHISDGTLQRLRIKGILKPKKVNGTWFYKLSDIEKLIEDNNESD